MYRNKQPNRNSYGKGMVSKNRWKQFEKGQKKNLKREIISKKSVES
jgi:hypothetical protein